MLFESTVLSMPKASKGKDHVLALIAAVMVHSVILDSSATL